MPTVAWRGLSPVWALAFGCYSLTWPGPPAVPTLASGCRSLAPLCLPPSLAPMQPCPWCRCDNLACHGPQLSLTPVLVIVPGFGPELPAPFPLPRCPAAPLPLCLGSTHTPAGQQRCPAQPNRHPAGDAVPSESTPTPPPESWRKMGQGPGQLGGTRARARGKAEGGRRAG